MNQILISKELYSWTSCGYFMLCLISFYLNSRLKNSDPGYIGNPIIMHTTSSLEDLVSKLKIQKNTKPAQLEFKLPMFTEKYCFICRINKEANIYHCGTVGRCVEQFDHYCFILGNAIGKQNYNLFILAVLLITTVIMWSLIILYSSVAYSVERIAFYALIPALLMSGGVLGFHIYLKLTRQNTMDFMKRNKLH